MGKYSSFYNYSHTSNGPLSYYKDQVNCFIFFTFFKFIQSMFLYIVCFLHIIISMFQILILTPQHKFTTCSHSPYVNATALLLYHSIMITPMLHFFPCLIIIMLHQEIICTMWISPINLTGLMVWHVEPTISSQQRSPRQISTFTIGRGAGWAGWSRAVMSSMVCGSLSKISLFLPPHTEDTHIVCGPTR